MATRNLAARLAIPNPYDQPAVVIFHVKGKPPDSVLHLFDERIPLQVIWERDEWFRTDLVIYTSGGLTAARERFAARMNAMCVILPAQVEWLRAEIEKRLQYGPVYLFIYHAGAEVVS